MHKIIYNKQIINLLKAHEIHSINCQETQTIFLKTSSNYHQNDQI